MTPSRIFFFERISFAVAACAVDTPDLASPIPAARTVPSFAALSSVLLSIAVSSFLGPDDPGAPRPKCRCGNRCLEELQVTLDLPVGHMRVVLDPFGALEVDEGLVHQVAHDLAAERIGFESVDGLAQ